MGATQRANARLPKLAEIIELDVTNDENLANLSTEIKKHATSIDGVVHAIGFAPQSALGGNFLQTEWPDVATALHVSAYSFKSLSMACIELMPNGGSIVGLDFDAKISWPQYDWMGVAKAALESTSRYLARHLGWKISDPVPSAKAVVALLSDWFPATSGEIIHVDGGYHSMGA